MPDISRYQTPESRLLIAVYGGVSAYLGRPVTRHGDIIDLPPTDPTL